MKTLLAGTLAFLALSAAPSALLSLALVYGGAKPRVGARDDLFLALYLLALTACLAAAGFFLATALDRRWRSLAWPRAALIAGCLGLLTPLARLAVAAADPAAFLSLFHSAPRLATGLLYLIPGIALGMAAALLGRATQRVRP